jgi:hypothetical protein
MSSTLNFAGGGLVGRMSSIETDGRLESSSASAIKGFATDRYFFVGSRWPSQCGLRTSLCELNHCQPQNPGACFFPSGVGASPALHGSQPQPR